VFGQDLHPTVHLKAALYARNILTNHPFLDGNKRTGMTLPLLFLEHNGFKVTLKQGEIEKFALKIIADKLELEDIADWLQKHSAKISK
jgi:death-on-curing protein